MPSLPLRGQYGTPRPPFSRLERSIWLVERIRRATAASNITSSRQLGGAQDAWQERRHGVCNRRQREVVRLTKSRVNPGHAASGYRSVTWTGGYRGLASQLLALGVNDGIITAIAPTSCLRAVASFDAIKTGWRRLLGLGGLIDPTSSTPMRIAAAAICAPKTRCRRWSPGSTSLITTLETDCGLTSDNVPVLYIMNRVFRAD